jgi:hypothetical protein
MAFGVGWRGGKDSLQWVGSSRDRGCEKEVRARVYMCKEGYIADGMKSASA